MSVTSTVSASPMFTFGASETLNGDGIANQIVSHTAHEVRPGNLAAAHVTAPVAVTSQRSYALVAGTLTIDLTTLLTLLGETDCSGKKIQGVRFTNLAGNDAMALSGEGANGYSLGGEFPIPSPSADTNCVIVIWNPEAFSDVAAGVKELVITGTDEQEFYLDLLAG